MKSQELREKFLKYFESKGHKVVPSSSLIPSDPSVLFTTAGMQQFKEYFVGKPSPYGKRVASVQKCVRTTDIEEVGDETHLTFFEMLGNFSFGDYFKKEAISFAFEFLTQELNLPLERLYFTVFKGEGNIPPDEESEKIWQALGIPKEKIFKFGMEDNFWGPTGKEGPCGPTTEIHYQVKDQPCSKGNLCIPNCECGRFVEIWNLVFNEYFKDQKGNFTLLSQQGVDTGAGFERMLFILQKEENVFDTDVFKPLLEILQSKLKVSKYSNEVLRSLRIIADHLKSSAFIIADGVLPSNLERGYVLRRLIRRVLLHFKLLDLDFDLIPALVERIGKIYASSYPEVKECQEKIIQVISSEKEKFSQALKRALTLLEKISKKQDFISGKEAFDLYQTYGLPPEILKEIGERFNLKVDLKGFEEAKKEHQLISKKGAEQKFGGIGKDPTYEATKLHTATHLLHQALREVLGTHIRQMGSDITPERLRFDFTHPKKLTSQELKKVEDLVNQKIKEDLKVIKEEMSLKEALESGALAFFKEKYPERVTVYSIGDFSKNPPEIFSKEICGGPHVKRTSELGYFKIVKEESVSAGVRRIRAILISEV